jgi:hypothetical protein
VFPLVHDGSKRDAIHRRDAGYWGFVHELRQIAIVGECLVLAVVGVPGFYDFEIGACRGQRPVAYPASNCYFGRRRLHSHQGCEETSTCQLAVSLTKGDLSSQL